jgi:four helix bundle protein
MALQVHGLALDLVTSLRPLASAIARHDRDLARQLRRAATSIVLSIAEGEHSDPGNRRARFHSAAGSANETRAALQVATAWRYIRDEQVGVSLSLVDRVLAMLRRLTH